MSGYTKLFGSILDSTVWDLPHATVRVWVTMLAMADRHGEVHAAVPGLAHRARVTLEEAETALAAFLAPDKYSRTPDNDGRRIEAIDRGWRLVNHEKYTRLMSEEDRKARAVERQQRYIKSRQLASTNVNHRQSASTGVNKRQNDDTQTRLDADKTETRNGSDSLLAASGSSKPTVYRFLCNGPAAVWYLTQEQLDAWEPLYPGVDIIAECGKALAWLEANGRKTARGMPKFLVGWLNRANDKPRLRSPPIDRYQQTLAAGQRFLERHEGDD